MIDTTQHISEVFNEDCMVGMARYPDKWFDLAVVDPPYGVKIGKQSLGLGGGFTKNTKVKPYKMGDWDDDIPPPEYFKELARISKNQIIWGGNYMTEHLPPSPSWLFWDKKNGESDFGDGELAWSSFRTPIRRYEFLWAGCFQGDPKNKQTRIHPTQKPIQLYSWIYGKFLPQGGKVIDTHLGSGSNRIAANKAGNIDFTGFELDKDYYEAQEKRWKGFIAQTRLF